MGWMTNETIFDKVKSEQNVSGIRRIYFKTHFNKRQEIKIWEEQKM